MVLVIVIFRSDSQQVPYFTYEYNSLISLVLKRNPYQQFIICYIIDHRCCMQKSHNCGGKFATETCCSSTSKCEEGEGHCSSDSVCGSGLKCGIQNCDYSLGFKFGYNCCYKA